MPSSDYTNCQVLVKGDEKFIFIYLDSKLPELFRSLVRFAADEHLSFSWQDAAFLRRKAIDQAKQM